MEKEWKSRSTCILVSAKNVKVNLHLGLCQKRECIFAMFFCSQSVGDTGIPTRDETSETTVRISFSLFCPVFLISLPYHWRRPFLMQNTKFNIQVVFQIVFSRIYSGVKILRTFKYFLKQTIDQDIKVILHCPEKRLKSKFKLSLTFNLNYLLHFI